MATDLERLVVLLEANMKKFDNEMKRAEGVTDKTASNIEKRFAQSNKAAAASTANLAAQFQDIAVQLQGGASPLTVALQQGTQIGQVIGQRGAAGAVSLLGSAFASLVSPVNLATIGIIALGGAAISYFTKSSDSADVLNDQLKEHEKLIDQLKRSYGELGKSIDTDLRGSTDVAETLVRSSVNKIQEEYQKLSKAALKTMSDLRTVSTETATALGDITGFDPSTTTAGFIAFSGAIENFRKSVAAGKPDLQAFRVEVSQIEASTADKQIKLQAAALLEMTSEGNKAAEALAKIEKANSSLAAALSGDIERFKDFAKALKDLSGISLPKLDDRARIAQAYEAAIINATGAEERLAATRARDAALGRVAAAEKAEAAKEAARLAEREDERSARRIARDAKAFADDIANTQKSIDAIRLETETIGLSEQERDRMRMQLQLENEARKANQLEIEGTKEKIAQLSTAYAEVRQKSREANEVMLEIRNFGSIAADAFRGLVLEGKKFDDVLKNIMERLQNRIIDKIFNGLFESIGGSITGSLFGGARASGGPVSSGQTYLVGERGPELFTPSRSGMIVPNHAMGGGRSSSTPVNVKLMVVEDASRAGTAEQRSNNGDIDLMAFVDSVTARNVSKPGSSTRRAMQAQGALVRR